MPAEVAVGKDVIGLIPPPTKQQFQFLLAEALAEVAGASNAASVRSLASALLPLVLCTKADDLHAYLDRAGFSGHAQWGVQDSADGVSDDFHFNVEDDALEQVFDSLNTDHDEDPEPVQPAAHNEPPRNPNLTPTPQPPPPPLPDLGEVTLTVADTTNAEITPLR